MADILWSVDR